MSLKCTSNLVFITVAVLAGIAGNTSCKKKAEPPVIADAAAPPPALEPPTPAFGLVVEAPGTEPLLAYSFKSKAPESFELSFDTETKTKRGNLVSSTIHVSGTLQPTVTAESGTLQIAIAGVNATDRDRQLVDAAGINYYLKNWTPPTFAIGVTPTGDMSTDASVWKFPEMLFNQEQAIHDTVGKWLPVYPPDAIGDGATWTQIKSDIVNGVTVVRTTKFVLSRTAATTAESGLEIKATFRETAHPQQAAIEGAPLQVTRYAAEGTTTYALKPAADTLAKEPPWIGSVSGNVVVSMGFDNKGTEESIVRTTAWTLGPATAKPAKAKAPATKP